MLEEQTAVATADGQAQRAADGQPVEQQPTTSPPTQGTAPTNWDSEENPYKQRYTGLQGTFKQVQQQYMQVQAQQRAQEEQYAVQAAVAQAQADGRSTEEIEQVRQGAQQQLMLMRALEEQATQSQMERQTLEPLARQIGIQQIAQRHGIDPSELADSPSPQAAEWLAQRLAKLKREQTTQQRQSDGVDRMESGGGGTRDYERLSTDEKFERGVQEYMRKHQDARGR